MSSRFSLNSGTKRALACSLLLIASVGFASAPSSASSTPPQESDRAVVASASVIPANPNQDIKVKWIQCSGVTWNRNKCIEDQRFQVFIHNASLGRAASWWSASPPKQSFSVPPSEAWLGARRAIWAVYAPHLENKIVGTQVKAYVANLTNPGSNFLTPRSSAKQLHCFNNTLDAMVGDMAYSRQTTANAGRVFLVTGKLLRGNLAFAQIYTKIGKALLPAAAAVAQAGMLRQYGVRLMSCGTI